MGKIDQFLKNTNKDTINVIRNIFNSVIIKGGGIVVGLLTTPAYMNYFENHEILGVWFTILSVISWMLNFDLGIGKDVANYINCIFVGVFQELIYFSHWYSLHFIIKSKNSLCYKSEQLY